MLRSRLVLNVRTPRPTGGRKISSKAVGFGVSEPSHIGWPQYFLFYFCLSLIAHTFQKLWRAVSRKR